MSDATLKFSPFVESRGLKIQIFVALQEAPKVFAHHGFDCYLTSLVRPGDEASLHGYGYAADFDASIVVGTAAGRAIRDELQTNLGAQYQVIWHAVPEGRFHIHVEFDPDNEGIKRVIDELVI